MQLALSLWGLRRGNTWWEWRPGSANLLTSGTEKKGRGVSYSPSRAQPHWFNTSHCVLRVQVSAPSHSTVLVHNVVWVESSPPPPCYSFSSPLRHPRGLFPLLQPRHFPLWPHLSPSIQILGKTYGRCFLSLAFSAIIVRLGSYPFFCKHMLFFFLRWSRTPLCPCTAHFLCLVIRCAPRRIP